MLGSKGGMMAITKVSAYLVRTGNPAGNAVLSLYEADASGFPSGAALGSVAKEAATISTSATWADFVFASAIETSAARYVFVLSLPSGSTGEDHISWYGRGSGGLTPLGCHSTDSGLSWFNSGINAYRVYNGDELIDSTISSIVGTVTIYGSIFHGNSFLYPATLEPVNPTPVDAAENIDIEDAQLTWECDGEPDHYEVWFGTALGGPTLRGTTGDKFWNVPFTLDIGIEYEWKIVAIYGEDEASSEVWSFTTRPLSFYLSKPVNPTPEHEQSGVPISTATLTWENGGGATSYDVYIGEGDSGSLVKVSDSTSAVSYAIRDLKYSTTYYWRVDARNQFGEVQGDVWEFAIHSLQSAGQIANVIKRRLVAAAKDRIWYEET